MLSPPPDNSRYYYYRLLDKAIDQHILQHNSERWDTGVPPHFKLGSGAGFLKRPAPALLHLTMLLILAIFHGTLFWWTTMVDYPVCAVNLRGARLGLSKATCDSDAFRYPKVSLETDSPTLTTLRYYTPTTSPPSPTRDVFEDTKHATMLNARNRAAPPRRLTATSATDTQHASNDATLRDHWIKITIFGILWVALGCVVGYMRGADDTRTTGPFWDPSGNVPFRDYVREVHAWVNVTTGTMTPSQQAACLQRGLGGLARTIAMRVPSIVINFGVNIGGRHTDAVTYIMFLLSQKFENLEDERQLNSGTALIDFRPRPGERIDQTLARFEIARYEADNAGFQIPNFQLLTVILFRALGVGSSRAATLLQPLDHQMPRTQQQFDSLIERMRSYAHIAERTPGNIGDIFTHGHRTATFQTNTSTAGQPASSVWNDDQPTETTSLLTVPGGQALGSWADNTGLTAQAPAQSFLGSAGQPAGSAEEEFDSGTDSDTSSDDGAEDIDFSDVPVHLTEAQQAVWVFLGYRHHKRRWRRFMKKPVRKIRRTIRREFGRKGKGKGKGKRRRLHGRGVLAFLASLPDADYEEILFGKGKGKGRRNSSGKGKGRKGNPKDRDGKTMECDICGSTQHFRRECPKGDGKGRAPSAHLAQTSDDVEYVDLESFLASETASPSPVYFMAMQYMDAAGFLTDYTEELYEAIFPDGDENDLEEWIGLPPYAGQPATTTNITAGQPADDIGMGPEEFYIGDDDSTIPATEEELQQALADITPQVIGLASDMPLHHQYYCGVNDGTSHIFMLRDNAGHSADRPRSQSQVWRRVQRTEDDDEEWPADDPPRRSNSRRVTLRARERSASIIRRPAPRRGRSSSRGRTREEAPEVHPETGHAYVTEEQDGVSRWNIPDDVMDTWLAKGWTEHQIKHWYSLRKVNRNEDGQIIRSQRASNTRSSAAMASKATKKEIIADRKTYREQVCVCFAYMDHRPNCPMKRESRSPNFKRTPWAWSHGDGRGHNVDPTNPNNPAHTHLSESDLIPINDTEVEATWDEWRLLPYTHRLKVHHREYHGDDEDEDEA